MSGKIITKEIKELAEDIFYSMKNYCCSIYLGGSLVKKTIKNSHDIDFICFGFRPVDMAYIRRNLYFYFKHHPEIDKTKYDFIQVRCKDQEEHDYGSYVNKQMIKLVGEDLEFTFDIINKDRVEYIKILKETATKLINDRIRNKKRWYQLLEGYYIMTNKSYELTEEQIKNINILHDLKAEDEVIRAKLIEELIANINAL